MVQAKPIGLVDNTDAPIDWAQVQERIDSADLQRLVIPRSQLLQVYFDEEKKCLISSRAPWIHELLQYQIGDIGCEAFMATKDLSSYTPQFKKLMFLGMTGVIPLSALSAIPSHRCYTIASLFASKTFDPALWGLPVIAVGPKFNRDLPYEVDFALAHADSIPDLYPFDDSIIACHYRIRGITDLSVQAHAIPSYLGLFTTCIAYAYSFLIGWKSLHPHRIRCRELVCFLVRNLSSPIALQEHLRFMETIRPDSPSFEPQVFVTLAVHESAFLQGFLKAMTGMDKAGQ